MRTRTRRSVGRPTAAVMRRGDALAKAHGRVALPQCGRLQQPGLGGQGGAVLECHALAQAAQLFFGGAALHLHPVGLGQLVARVGNAGLQGAVVGQQQQALAVAVQAARRVHTGHVHKVLERGAALGVGAELGQYVKGFVQQQQARHRWWGFGHAPCARRAPGGGRQR